MPAAPRLLGWGRPLGVQCNPPSAHWVLPRSTFSKCPFIWNSLGLSDKGLTPAPHQLMKASSQGTKERPFLLQSFSPLSRFFLCVPLFQSLASPTVSFPAPPVAVSSAAVSRPACLGCGPAALPGRPPWLPLCGSQL